MALGAVSRRSEGSGSGSDNGSVLLSAGGRDRPQRRKEGGPREEDRGDGDGGKN